MTAAILLGCSGAAIPGHALASVSVCRPRVILHHHNRAEPIWALQNPFSALSTRKINPIRWVDMEPDARKMTFGVRIIKYSSIICDHVYSHYYSRSGGHQRLSQLFYFTTFDRTFNFLHCDPIWKKRWHLHGIVDDYGVVGSFYYNATMGFNIARDPCVRCRRLAYIFQSKLYSNYRVLISNGKVGQRSIYVHPSSKFSFRRVSGVHKHIFSSVSRTPGLFSTLSRFFKRVGNKGYPKSSDDQFKKGHTPKPRGPIRYFLFCIGMVFVMGGCVPMLYCFERCANTFQFYFDGKRNSWLNAIAWYLAAMCIGGVTTGTMTYIVAKYWIG